MANFSEKHPVIAKLCRIAMKMVILVVIINFVFYFLGVGRLPDWPALFDFQRIDEKMDILWIKIKRELGRLATGLSNQFRVGLRINQTQFSAR